MKSRNREINIFNMSLLDILCGALGAFCFMMLSLLPYYHPPGEDFKKVTEEQKKMLDEVKDVKDLLEKLKFTSNAEDQRELVKQLQEKIDELENKIKELQGQVNSLMAEKAELKKQIEALKEEKEKLLARNDQLEKENEKLQQEKEKLEKEKRELEEKLDQKTPWVTNLIPVDVGQPVEVYLREVKLTSMQDKFQPPYDPDLKFHYTHWPGDYLVRLGATTSWISGDRVRGSEIKVYGKLMNGLEQRMTTEVSGWILGDRLTDIAIPSFTLTPERFWTLVGTIAVDDNRVPKFTVATQEEREAEWVRLTKAPPPARTAPEAPQAPNATRRGDRSSPDVTPLGEFSPEATRRMRTFASALLTAQSQAEKQGLYQRALLSAADAKERETINLIMIKTTGSAPPAPRAPGAGPAVPFGVNPGPPAPAAPSPAPTPTFPK